MKRLAFYRLVFSLAIIWVSGKAGHAQTLFGSLVGNVKDASEAAVAGATVTLTNLETRQSRQVTTTDAGSYDFPTISAGNYSVKNNNEEVKPQTQKGTLVEG